MDKDTVANFHADLDMVIDQLCEKWNMERVKSNITYSDTDLSISLKLLEKSSDGSFKVDTIKDLKLMGAIIHYIPAHLKSRLPKNIQGLELVVDGRNCRIIDWNNRARSYPIIYKTVSDGKQFKCSPQYMAKYVAIHIAQEDLFHEKVAV